MAAHSVEEFDLVVVGPGPAGQGAAIQAAALGARVAVVERDAPGGRSTYAGLIPAHTLRAAIEDVVRGAEAVGKVAGEPNRELYLDDLMWRAQSVREHESNAALDRFRRRGIPVFSGTASFVGPHVLEVRGPDRPQQIRGDRIVLAVGTLPHRPEFIEFDGRTVVDADEIVKIRRVPQRLLVVGAGRVGLEYASMLSALGVCVTLVDQCQQPMGYLDDELSAELAYHLRGSGVSLQFGRAVTGIKCTSTGPSVRLSDGVETQADAVLVAVGRRPDFAPLELPAAGFDLAEPWCREGDIQTQQPHIFVAGDAIGAAGTTPAAIEQGRHAALIALGCCAPPKQPMPDTLYTSPELSFVGATEQELAAAGIAFVAGVSTYRELLRGEVAGDSFGRLKLLVHRETREILGVHILGKAAAELVHIGQTAMAGNLRLDFFAQAAFNYPTFSDAYTDAALDAAMKLRPLRG